MYAFFYLICLEHFFHSTISSTLSPLFIWWYWSFFIVFSNKNWFNNTMRSYMISKKRSLSFFSSYTFPHLNPPLSNINYMCFINPLWVIMVNSFKRAYQQTQYPTVHILTRTMWANRDRLLSIKFTCNLNVSISPPKNDLFPLSKSSSKFLKETTRFQVQKDSKKTF